MLLLLLIFSILFQSDKKPDVLVLVKNQIFPCHTYLATYKIHSFVTFLPISLLDNTVQFNASFHKYNSFMEISLESVTYIFHIFSILYIYAFSKVDFQKNS